MPLIDSGPIEEFIQNGLNSGKFGHDAIEIFTEVHYAPEAVVRCEDCIKCGYCGEETNLEVMGFYGFCSRGKKRGEK